MPYALKCNGGQDFASAPVVSIPAWTPSNQSNWGCRVKIKTGADINSDRMICGCETSGGAGSGDVGRNFKLAITSGGIVALYGTYWDTNNWLRISVTANTEYDLLYKVTSTAFELWNNATNILLVSKTLPNRLSANTPVAVNAVGKSWAQFNQSQQSPDATYYNVDFIDYATPANTRNYDPSLSVGTGTTLPTTQGTNAGTLSGNWPSDDSEWIFYSSGNYLISADGGTFAYSGAVANTLLNRRLSANGRSFSYSGASSALRFNRLLTVNGSAFSYADASADLLLNRQLSADGASFAYSGAAATLTYAQITGFVLNADGGSFSTAGGEVEFVYVQNFPEANANDFTVSSIADSSFSFESRISPTVSFSAIISSTFQFNGSLN